MLKAKCAAAFAGLSVIWGSSWIADSALSDSLPPFRAAALRYAIAAALLLAIAFARRKWTLSRSAVEASVVLGVGLLALPYLLLSWGGQHLSTGTTALIFAGTPLAAAAITIGAKRSVVPRSALYAALVGVGAMAVVMSRSFAFSLSQAGSIAAVALAALSTAGSLVYAKTVLRGVNLSASAGLQLASAAAVMAIASLATERPEPWQPLSEAPVLGLLYLALLGSAVALPLYYWLLEQLQPYQLATVEWMQPLVAIATGAIVLRQAIPATVYGGTAVLLGCLAVVLRASPEDEEPLTLRVTSRAAQETGGDKSS